MKTTKIFCMIYSLMICHLQFAWGKKPDDPNAIEPTHKTINQDTNEALNDFLSKWKFGPIEREIKDQTEVQHRTFERIVWVGNTMLPVSQTTYTHIKNPKEKTNI